MPLVSLNEIYADANRNYYAIGQFNVSNLEFIQAIIKAAKETSSPIILGVSSSALEYAGAENIVAMARIEADRTGVPVAVHLDHGPTFEMAVQCIEAGFTSVMIDGSHCSLDENIRVTREVADYAHKHDVTVEAELGRLGGIEDEIKVDAKDACLTDPDEAERFVNESHCDALAVAVGTSHGAYKFKEAAKLDFERIKTIKKRLNIPLVLHGASGVSPEVVAELTKYGGKMADAKGVPDDAYRKAIAAGINKINIDTDLRLTFTATVRRTLTEKPELFDPRKIIGSARDVLVEVAKQKIALFGSDNKATTIGSEGTKTNAVSV